MKVVQPRVWECVGAVALTRDPCSTCAMPRCHPLWMTCWESNSPFRPPLSRPCLLPSKTALLNCCLTHRVPWSWGVLDMFDRLQLCDPRTVSGARRRLCAVFVHTAGAGSGLRHVIRSFPRPSPQRDGSDHAREQEVRFITCTFVCGPCPFVLTARANSTCVKWQCRVPCVWRSREQGCLRNRCGGPSERSTRYSNDAWHLAHHRTHAKPGPAWESCHAELPPPSRATVQSDGVAVVPPPSIEASSLLVRPPHCHSPAAARDVGLQLALWPSLWRRVVQTVRTTLMRVDVRHWCGRG